MKRAVKIFLGIVLTLCGVGLALLGIYMTFQGLSWQVIGGLIVLVGLGYLLADLGLALIRGDSIKDAVYYLVRGMK